MKKFLRVETCLMKLLGVVAYEGQEIKIYDDMGHSTEVTLRGSSWIKYDDMCDKLKRIAENTSVKVKVFFLY